MRPRTTIYGLIGIVSLAGLFFALVRFLMMHPDLTTPVTIVGAFLGFLFIPAVVSRYQSRSVRIRLGFYLLPILVCLIAVAFIMLMAWLPKKQAY